MTNTDRKRPSVKALALLGAVSALGLSLGVVVDGSAAFSYDTHELDSHQQKSHANFLKLQSNQDKTHANFLKLQSNQQKTQANFLKLNSNQKKTLEKKPGKPW
jgi:hypothetical protein